MTELLAIKQALITLRIVPGAGIQNTFHSVRVADRNRIEPASILPLDQMIASHFVDTDFHNATSANQLQTHGCLRSSINHHYHSNTVNCRFQHGDPITNDWL